ncbi:hypothetical protein ACWEVD_19500 [Nocardia thailandica]
MTTSGLEADVGPLAAEWVTDRVDVPDSMATADLDTYVSGLVNSRLRLSGLRLSCLRYTCMFRITTQRMRWTISYLTESIHQPSR